MTIVDQIVALAGAVLAGVGGTAGVVRLIRWWRERGDRLEEKRIESQERTRLAELAADDAAAARDERTITRLAERVDVLEASKDDCQAALADQRVATEGTKAHADRCERELGRAVERITSLERQVPRIREDITERIEIAAQKVADKRSSPPPPPPRPAIPPPKRNR